MAALLLDALDQHKMHLRARGRFADGSGIVGIVLSALPCRPQAGLLRAVQLRAGAIGAAALSLAAGKGPPDGPG